MESTGASLVPHGMRKKGEGGGGPHQDCKDHVCPVREKDEPKR